MGRGAEPGDEGGEPRDGKTHLALDALQPEHNLLGGLGLLVEDGLGLTTVTALLSVVPTLSLAVEVLVSLVMGLVGIGCRCWVEALGRRSRGVWWPGARLSSRRIGVRGIRTRTERPGNSVSNRVRGAWRSGERTLPALYCVTLWAVCLRHSLPLQ